MGDDALLIPGSIRHAISILNNSNDLSLLILSGTNIADDQTTTIQQLIRNQGEVVRASRREGFICGFWLQTLGCISYLVLNTDRWRKSGYGNQKSYFIYPQIRSVLEMAQSGGLYFSNRHCVYNYRVNEKHNHWYLDKNSVSVVIEFPWLQEYARKLGFNEYIHGGLHKGFFRIKLKQWIRMIISHPYYSEVYGEAIKLEHHLLKRLTMIFMLIALIPIRRPVQYLARKRGLVLFDKHFSGVFEKA
jgi:hypothetical protein